MELKLQITAQMRRLLDHMSLVGFPGLSANQVALRLIEDGIAHFHEKPCFTDVLSMIARKSGLNPTTERVSQEQFLPAEEDSSIFENGSG